MGSLGSIGTENGTPDCESSSKDVNGSIMSKLLHRSHVVVEIIRPTGSSTVFEHPEYIDCSPLDLFCIDTYVSTLYVYKPDDSTAAFGTVSGFVENLKESLAKVLVPYYPFAGRWVKTLDDRMRSLHCNDEGVPFIEAYIGENMESLVNFNDFKPEKLLCGHDFVGLDAEEKYSSKEEPLPSAFVQVTTFKCGGVTVCSTVSHMTADGVAMVNFMQAWSKMALGCEISEKPETNRSLSIPGVSEFLTSIVDKGMIKACRVPTRQPQTDPPTDLGQYLRLPSNKITQKILHVPRSTIESIKAEAAILDLALTTNDIIAAHLWQSFNSIPSSVDGQTISAAGIMVEGRSRFLLPPLPSSYIGNVAIHAMPKYVLIQSSESGSFSQSRIDLAQLLHQCVRSLNSSNWEASYARLLSTAAYNLPRILFSSSWSRFPVYSVDFGYGKPALVALNSVTTVVPFNHYFILPCHPDDPDNVASVHLHIVTGPMFDSLMANQDFRSFFA